MRIRKLVILFTAVMLFFLLLFTTLLSLTGFEKRNIVYYNDLLYRIEDDMAAGRDIGEIEKEYKCTIVLSKELDDPRLSELYSNEAFVLDLVVNDEYIGKAAWQDLMERNENLSRGFFRATMFMWSTILILGYLLLFLIYLSFVRPTKDLTDFSTELAKGNLDVTLPMRRYNPFGGFTEAFDLMREELKSSQKRRMETEIARRELVASLSHDIKTPVAVIEATCELMDVRLKRELENPGQARGQADTDDLIDKIATISTKAQTISSIMSDLMHSNMEDSEKLAVEPKEEFSSLIEDYFRNLRNYGNIVIKNPIPKCLVYMDKKRMEQVIDNIVGNSHKYAGTDIIVSFDESDDYMMPDASKSSFIRITVSDSGPGVSEEDLPLIAQKYYRGSNSADAAGYGLGLYLVKLYMQKQGGDMEYYNDNGFTVRLMLRKV